MERGLKCVMQVNNPFEKMGESGNYEVSRVASALAVGQVGWYTPKEIK